MSETLYVGVDISKKTLDLAAVVEGRVVAATKRVGNDGCGYRSLEGWARERMQRAGCARIHYVMESTGVYGEGVAEYLMGGADTGVSVINPASARSFGKTLSIRTKTDKVDAKVLGIYGASLKPQAMVKMSEGLKELRTLERYLEYLIERRGQERVRLESATNPVVRGSIRQIIGGYDAQIKEIEKQIEEQLKEHPQLKCSVELLESITGIGHKTSTILVCELHAQGGEGEISAKAQTAHAGLAPHEKSSGTSVRGKSHICRTGNSRLRKCLYFPAMSAIRHNPIVRELYTRLVNKGKPKKLALVAAMRKLLVIAVGVLNNKTPFDPNWAAHRNLCSAP